MISAIKREKCIVCNKSLGNDHVFIGNQYPSAVFPEKNSDYKKTMPPSSLNLTKCINNDCGLVQLSYEYNLDYVFDNYPYESASTATMLDKLKDIVDETESIVSINKDDTVLDIGGNDGSMLNLMKTKVKKRVNFDAAAGVDSVFSSKDYVRVEGLFNADDYRSNGFDNPKLIYSVAMFYHLNNPVQFCKEVRSIMNDDTVWCIQMTYLGTMLQDNIYDNIVHEHVAYYSLKSLSFLFDSLGMEIIKAKVVDSYGGSLRVHVVKKSSKKVKLDSEVTAYEKKYEINNLSSVLAFNQRIHTIKEATLNIVNHIVEEDGKLVALGASTKGNMICQFVELGADKIQYILDNNKKKIGLITTGTEIPIVEEDQYLNEVPKYILILPYYYIDFFIELIRKKLAKGEKSYLIVPLPVPHFIKVESN